MCSSDLLTLNSDDITLESNRMILGSSRIEFRSFDDKLTSPSEGFMSLEANKMLLFRSGNFVTLPLTFSELSDVYSNNDWMGQFINNHHSNMDTPSNPNDYIYLISILTTSVDQMIASIEDSQAQEIFYDKRLKLFMLIAENSKYSFSYNNNVHAFHLKASTLTDINFDLAIVDGESSPFRSQYAYDDFNGPAPFISTIYDNRNPAPVSTEGNKVRLSGLSIQPSTIASPTYLFLRQRSEGGYVTADGNEPTLINQF